MSITFYVFTSWQTELSFVYSCDPSHIITCHMRPGTCYSEVLLKKKLSVLKKVISSLNIYSVWFGKEFSFKMILKGKCSFQQNVLICQGWENSLNSNEIFLFVELNQHCIICSTLDSANFWWQDALWKLLFRCLMPVVSPGAWPWLTCISNGIPHNWSSGAHQETVRFLLILFSPRFAHSLTPFYMPQTRKALILLYNFLHHDEQSHLLCSPLSINKN